MNFTETTQREYKDRLFKAIFGRNTEESKRWRLDLYNALNDTTYTDPNALELNTIETVIYITMHNDVSFLIDDQMVLFEQQSSHNLNMPLRGFLYFAQLYQRYLVETDQDVNRCKKIEIPAPQFIVFYNGTTDIEDEFEMRLSDSFMYKDDNRKPSSGAYEFTAYVKNINENHSEGLQKKCNALYDYSRFVGKVRRNKGSGMEVHAAVKKAVDEAVEENLLEGFFARQKAEVIGMILEEFDEERFKRNMREEGAYQKAIEDAENFLKMGVGTPEQISQAIGLPLEQVLKIKENLSVKV